MVESATEASQWMVLLRAVLSLAAVIALIYALAWFIKKYLKPERWARSGGSEIKILESYVIEPKKKLMIVEVRDKHLLIGVAEQNISFLSTLPSESSAEVSKK